MAEVPKKLRKLRDIPLSDRFFWRESFEEQLQLKVLDQTPEYNTKTLPLHETLTVALQEVAVEHQHGFFFYLPTRSALTSFPAEDRLPFQRQLLGSISPEYLDILYMDFAWDVEDQQNFRAASHRSRYLKAGFLTNPPPLITPLVTLQVIDRQNLAPYRTTTESLVLFVAEAGVYLASTSAFVEAKLARGPDRFAKPDFLWQSKKAAGQGGNARQAKKPKLAIPEGFVELTTLEDIYFEIRRRAEAITAKRTAQAVWQIIPRPEARRAASVGIPLGQGEKADPPSRRGEYRIRRSKKAGEGDMDSEANDDDNDGNGSEGYQEQHSGDGELEELAKTQFGTSELTSRGGL